MVSQKSVTLALKLKDQKTERVHGVVEKSINLSSNGEVEEKAKPFTDLIKRLTMEVKEICKQQNVQLSNEESLEQNLLINVLLSLAKEELNDVSIEIPVLEIAKPDETEEKGNDGNNSDTIPF